MVTIGEQRWLLRPSGTLEWKSSIQASTRRSTRSPHAALQEGVDVIGLSIMSGAHLPICQKLMKKLKEKKMEDTLVVVGGVIPKRDVPFLQKMGIHGIFPGGTPFDESTRWIKEHVSPGSSSGEILNSKHEIRNKH